MHPALPALVLIAAVAMTGACSPARRDPGQPVRTSTVVVSGAGAGGQSVVMGAATTTAAVARVVAVTPDSVWRVLPAVYDSLKIPVLTVHSAERAMGNTSLRVRRRLAGTALGRYFNCGGPPGMPNAEAYDLYISIVTRVRATEGTPDSADVMTFVEGSAKGSVGGPGDVVSCSSTGQLELRVFNLLRRLTTGS